MENLNIKERRTKLLVSQKELALKTGISRYKISDYECDYCQLSQDELLKINSYLDHVAQKTAETKRGCQW